MKFMKKRNGLLLTIFLLSIILIYSNNIVNYKCKSEQKPIYDDLGVPFLQEPLKETQIQEEVYNQKIRPNGKSLKVLIPKEEQITPKISSSSSVKAYEIHDPFYIDDNADFGPVGYNFTGDGTYSKPYLIEGYQITNSSYNLIHIENTTAFFKISSNLLNGVSNNYDGIYLKNVTHGIIFNNSVTNCVGAINLESSYNNTIDENVLSFSTNGVRLDYSNNNTISVNTVYNSTWSGIYTQYSHNNTCFNNTAYYNTWGGIWLSESTESKITLNYAYYNGWDGIGIHLSYNNKISDNNVYSNTLSGIKLINSSDNQLDENYVNLNQENGIYLDSSDLNTVEANYVYQNSEDGIFARYSTNNTIEGNHIYSNAENGNTLISSHYNVIHDNDIYCNGNTSACSPIGISLRIQAIPGGNGIFLDPSNCNNITSNRIYKNTDNGIRIESSNNNLIDGNDIYGNGGGTGGTPSGITDLSLKIVAIPGGNGIFLDPSTYNTIRDNNIFNNSDNGIMLENSSYNVIDGNDIYGNGGGTGGSPSGIADLSLKIQAIPGGNGIFLDPSDNNNITNNEIFNNSGDGIRIENSSNNYVWGNNIHNNGGSNGGSPLSISDVLMSIQGVPGGNGIFLDPSDTNMIGNNIIRDNRYNGILLFDTDETIIYNNLLIHNGLYGIFLDTGSVENQIYWNDFIGNNLDGSQAYNDGPENEFHHNFWDEWMGPDEEEDGIVDAPYEIAGDVGGVDSSPLTYPHNPESKEMHFISRPRVVYPNEGGTISGTITIEWVQATDFWDHTITYTVYLSANGGETWDQLESGITTLRFKWDTKTVDDGSLYVIKVAAICSEGLQAEDASDASFSIFNDQPPESSESEESRSTKDGGTPAPSLIFLLFSVSFVVLAKKKLRDRSN